MALALAAQLLDASSSSSKSSSGAGLTPALCSPLEMTQMSALVFHCFTAWLVCKSKKPMEAPICGRTLTSLVQ